MSLVPVLHRLLVKPESLDAANATYKKMRELGLEIPENEIIKKEQNAVVIGTVVAIGETAFKDYGATVVPKIGDKVYYAKYSGKEVTDNEVKYLLLNDEDICAIIKEEV